MGLNDQVENHLPIHRDVRHRGFHYAVHFVFRIKVHSSQTSTGMRQEMRGATVDERDQKVELKACERVD